MMKSAHHLTITGLLFTLLILPLATHAQNLNHADSLHTRGMAFYKVGKYGQADSLLAQAYHIYKRHAPPSVWLSPAIDYAEVLGDMSQNHKAIQLFNQLLQTAVALHDLRQQVRIKNDLGWLYKHLDNYNSSVRYLKEASSLAKQIKDTLRLAFINNNMGSIYKMKGHYATALKYHKKSLFYLQQLHKQRYICIALNNVALDYKSLSLFDKAQMFYKQSLTIRKQLGDVDLLSTGYNNMALLYKEAGSFDKALDFYQRSLHYGKQTGNPHETAQTLNNIGSLYQAFGKPEKALFYYHQSLKMKKQMGTPASIAHTQRNIANRLWALGRYQKALDYYHQALHNRERQGNPLSIGYSLLDLIDVDVARGRFKEAFEYVSKVTAIADSTQHHALQEKTALARGNLYYSRGNYHQALKAYRRSHKLSQYVSSSDQIYILQKLAFTYNKLKDDRAITYGQQAIKLIEDQRSHTGFKRQFKTDYFSHYSHFYTVMAWWWLNYRNGIAGAYHLLESGKARTLTDELAQATQPSDSSLPEEKQLQRRQKIADISVLYDSLRTAPAEVKKQRLRHKINTKELKLAAYESRLSHTYTGFNQREYPVAANLKQVQKMCGPDTAILEYGLTDKTLLVFFITHDNVRVKRFRLTESSSSKYPSHLALAVNQFRTAIRSNVAEDSIHTLSRSIYQRLIAPFKRNLQAYKNLLIVPDGFLAYVPFSALSSNGHYLLRQFNVKYSPSMTGYKWIHNPVAYSHPKMLAIANASANEHAQTPALPYAELEIKNVANLFPSKTILSGADVTEQEVKKSLHQPYAYIHIAAHSVMDEQHPAQSGIVLGKSQPTDYHIGNDGFLRSNEIFQMNLHSNLVVLSACKSGTGELVSGEGLMGLQRAFLGAGSSAVVVSLWDVYDRSTSTLMQWFYKHLLGNKGSTWNKYWHSFTHWIGWDDAIPFGKTASSMRAAKLSLLNSARYHHPVYWAPFIVVGR